MNQVYANLPFGTGVLTAWSTPGNPQSAVGKALALGPSRPLFEALLYHVLSMTSENLLVLLYLIQLSFSTL